MSEPHNNFSSLDYSQYEEDVEELEQETDKKFSFVVSIEEDGERIDKVLSSRYLDFSRSRLKTVIEEGDVLVDGESVSKPKQKLLLGQQVDVTVKSRPEDCPFTPTPMDLDIVYEDDSILVINKPAGLVVHPATGHWNDTLVNGLLAYNESFSKLPRAGVVHRLDRETSGLMVVAKTEQAQLSLVKQLQERTVKREYWALTRGRAPVDKIIDASIERDPRNPIKFVVGKSARAKNALTREKLVQFTEVNGKPYSWVACRLQTGRTHQIRVHMESIGFPLIGDPLYRNRLPVPKDDGTKVSQFNRQALHASRLGLVHPLTGEVMECIAEPPQDNTD
uniref:RluA family pseudouridine synthase n=1 Tax=Turicimonas muris TaxID=1796652 RepID=UPI0032200880